MHFRADRPPSTDPSRRDGRRGGFPDGPRNSPFDVFALLDLCVRAGDKIVAYYNDEQRSGLLREKADHSPLTQADITSHLILREGLASLDPVLPLLSEESDSEALAGRHEWHEFWMVDPLDGTREFLERTGQFTINIALVKEQRPCLGVIFEPLARRAFVGLVGEGAWRYQLQDGDWRSQRLHTRTLSKSELVVLASHRHRNERLARTLAFLDSRFSLERRNSGSALKFCDLAAGAGDCYPRYSPCSEWDVAAGDALVTAAGGKVVGLDGLPLRYNVRDTLLSENFLAVGDPDLDLWAELLQEVRP